MEKKRMDEETLESKKPYNKFQWFLIAITPVFFTIFVLLIVLTVAGVNVFQWSQNMGEKIPIISNFLEEQKKPSIDDLNQEIIHLSGDIKDREAEIGLLKSDLEQVEEEKDQLEEEIQRLEKKIESYELAPVEESGDEKQAFKDIIKTYEDMSPRKAAAIITALEDADAVEILGNVKANTLAGILEKMEPGDAARLTKQLAKNSE